MINEKATGKVVAAASSISSTERRRSPRSFCMGNMMPEVCSNEFDRALSVERLQNLVRVLYFQPGTRPACSIHSRNSGACASSKVFTFT